MSYEQKDPRLLQEVGDLSLVGFSARYANVCVAANSCVEASYAQCTAGNSIGRN